MKRFAEISATLLASTAIGAGAGVANYEFHKYILHPHIAATSDRLQRVSGTQESDFDTLNYDFSAIGGVGVGGIVFLLLDRRHRLESEVEPELQA